jgi:hypothetical protein
MDDNDVSITALGGDPFSASITSMGFNAFGGGNMPGAGNLPDTSGAANGGVSAVVSLTFPGDGSVSSPNAPKHGSPAAPDSMAQATRAAIAAALAYAPHEVNSGHWGQPGYGWSWTYPSHPWTTDWFGPTRVSSAHPPWAGNLRPAPMTGRQYFRGFQQEVEMGAHGIDRTIDGPGFTFEDDPPSEYPNNDPGSAFGGDYGTGMPLSLYFGGPGSPNRPLAEPYDGLQGSEAGATRFFDTFDQPDLWNWPERL